MVYYDFPLIGKVAKLPHFWKYCRKYGWCYHLVILEMNLRRGLVSKAIVSLARTHNTTLNDEMRGKVFRIVIVNNKFCCDMEQLPCLCRLGKLNGQMSLETFVVSQYKSYT